MGFPRGWVLSRLSFRGDEKHLARAFVLEKTLEKNDRPLLPEGSLVNIKARAYSGVFFLGYAQALCSLWAHRSVVGCCV